MDKRKDNKELARAHIEIQHFHKRWDPMEGLLKGTVFPELYRPYYPRQSKDEGPGKSKSSTKSYAGIQRVRRWDNYAEF